MTRSRLKNDFATGNVEISSGNLKLSSGNGVDFSSTSDASGASSELLDDYEEGTCTLSITSDATAPTVSSYGNQTAYYVKVGKLVTVTWYSDAINISNAGSGYARIAGLPYSASTAVHHYPVFDITHNSATTHACDGGYIYDSQMRLMQAGLSTSLTTWTSGNPKYIMAQATYRAA